jgi:hypothetical protein
MNKTRLELQQQEDPKDPKDPIRLAIRQILFDMKFKIYEKGKEQDKIQNLDEIEKLLFRLMLDISIGEENLLVIRSMFPEVVEKGDRTVKRPATVQSLRQRINKIVSEQKAFADSDPIRKRIYAKLNLDPKSIEVIEGLMQYGYPQILTQSGITDIANRLGTTRKLILENCNINLTNTKMLINYILDNVEKCRQEAQANLTQPTTPN